MPPRDGKDTMDKRTFENDGGIYFSQRDLLKLVIPLVIEQLLAIMVGLADSIMVAQVGEAAISAVSLVDSVNVLLINMFSSLATGGAVVVGQYLGRQEAGRAGRSGMQMLLLMAECSLLVMALMYVGKGFVLNVVFGQVEPDVAAYANTYYLIVELSIPFIALYNTGAALFRVMGNSGVSMRVSLLMNGINVAGNAILIFGLHMGVEGVAIPTLVSRMVAAVVILALLGRPGLAVKVGRPTFHHDLQMMKNILRFGVPNGMEGAMFQLGKIMLLSTIATMGTASVAANAIGNTLSGIEIAPGLAIGLGMVTVVSQCVGAGEIEKARYYTRKLMKMAVIAIAITVTLITVALPLILRLYNVSAEAGTYARQLMWTYGAAGILIWALAFTLPQALRAAGDLRFTMIVSSASMWIVRVGFGILLGRMGFGVLGVWLAMYCDWVVRISFFLPRYRGHKWEHMGISD